MASSDVDTVLRRPRARLPWLDGGSSSRVMPGAYDPEKLEVQILSSPLPNGTSVELGIVEKKLTASQYTPSTYSSSRRFDMYTDSQITLPRRDPASYEQLVEKPFLRYESTMPPPIPPRASSRRVNEQQNLPSIPFALNEPVDQSIKPIRDNTDGNLSSDAPSPNQIHRRKHHSRAVQSSHHQGCNMQEAVQNLQGLMDEALHVAADAGQQGRHDELELALEEAHSALNEASLVSAQMQKHIHTSDIDLSPNSDDYTADSSASSSSETFDSQDYYAKNLSNETMPTIYFTQSPRLFNIPNLGGPIISSPAKAIKDGRPVSDSDISPSTDTRSTVKPRASYTDETILSGHRSHGTASPASVVVDFAYIEQQPRVVDVRPSIVDIRFQRPQRASTTPFIQTVKANPEDIDQTFTATTIEKTVSVLKVVPPMPIPEVEEVKVHIPRHRNPSKRNVLHSFRPAEPGLIPQIEKEEVIVIPISDTAKLPVVPIVVDAEAAVKPVVGSDIIYGAEPGSGPRRFPDLGAEEMQRTRRLKYKRRPIAREWDQFRKRLTAVISCINTALVGLIAGIYAGEVPKIQYQLADTNHRVILGNVVFYIGLGITTLLAWPLPLLHGRKPYILVALGVTLPLQFPQALAVAQYRDTDPK